MTKFYVFIADNIIYSKNKEEIESENQVLGILYGMQALVSQHQIDDNLLLIEENNDLKGETIHKRNCVRLKKALDESTLINLKTIFCFADEMKNLAIEQVQENNTFNINEVITKVSEKFLNQVIQKYKKQINSENYNEIKPSDTDEREWLY